jgi:hypothetical protein
MMFRFVLGALVGGLAVWYWGEEIREYAENRTLGARKSAANMVRSVSKKAEDVLDQGTEAAQDKLRSSQSSR